MSLFRDEHGLRLWVEVSLVGLATFAFIGFLAWVFTSSERDTHRRLIECIEKTDDANWCLEVIE